MSAYERVPLDDVKHAGWIEFLTDPEAADVAGCVEAFITGRLLDAMVAATRLFGNAEVDGTTYDLRRLKGVGAVHKGDPNILIYGLRRLGQHIGYVPEWLPTALPITFSRKEGVH